MRGVAKVIDDGLIERELFKLVLTEISHFDGVTFKKLAARGLQPFRKHVEERGFSGAVIADDGDTLAALDVEGNVLENRRGVFGVLKRKIFCRQGELRAGAGGTEIKGHLVGVALDARETVFQLVHLRRHVLGRLQFTLGARRRLRFRSEFVDELHVLIDALLNRFDILRKETLFFHERLLESDVVALVRMKVEAAAVYDRE